MTDIEFNGKPVTKMKGWTLGEVFVWFEFFYEDGTSDQTLYLKGES